MFALILFSGELFKESIVNKVILMLNLKPEIIASNQHQEKSGNLFLIVKMRKIWNWQEEWTIQEKIWDFVKESQPKSWEIKQSKEWKNWQDWMWQKKNWMGSSCLKKKLDVWDCTQVCFFVYFLFYLFVLNQRKTEKLVISLLFLSFLYFFFLFCRSNVFEIQHTVATTWQRTFNTNNKKWKRRRSTTTKEISILHHNSFNFFGTDQTFSCSTCTLFVSWSFKNEISRKVSFFTIKKIFLFSSISFLSSFVFKTLLKSTIITKCSKNSPPKFVLWNWFCATLTISCSK